MKGRYFIDSHTLFFSTSLTLLKYCVNNVTPDYEAWEEILNLSTILGNKTTIKEIKRLQAGTRIHIKNEKIAFINYWNPEIPEKCDKKNFIKKNNELLFEALEYTRNINLQKTVLLSGGEDSRRIGLAAHEIGLSFTLATQEADTNGVDQNVLIAQEVSRKLNMPILTVKYPSPKLYFNNLLIRDYWLGYETHYHEWLLPLLSEITRNSLIYDGIIGDVTINGHWYRIYPDRYNTQDVDKIARDITEEHLSFKINDIMLDSTLYERVQDQLNRLPQCPSRVDYFYIMNRARRNISLFAQLHSLMGHKTCYPFLYYPLLMQSLSLDPIEKMDIYLQRQCMNALSPRVAKIPTTRDLLDKKYIINRKSQRKKIDKLIIRQLRIKPEVKALFPQQSLKINALRFSSVLGLNNYLLCKKWFIIPLLRISNYMDWLGDTSYPDFPLSVEQPGYLKSRFLS